VVLPLVAPFLTNYASLGDKRIDIPSNSVQVVTF
jgi:hypothetical protein